MVSFRNELEHLAHYVAIEQLRYPSIKVEYDVRADDFLVPSLSVQPLVENAIKHGASRRAGEGVVKVSSWREGRSFVVRVTDNGPGFDERSIARFKEGVDVGVPDNRRRRSARAQPCRTGERRGPRRRDLRRARCAWRTKRRRRQRDDDGSMRGRGRFAMIKPIVVDDERIALESLAKKLARIDGV